MKLPKTAKNKGVGIFGVVKRGGKKEIPEFFKLRQGEMYSRKILKHDNLSLTSYQGKKKKKNCCRCTLHPTLEVHGNEKKRCLILFIFTSQRNTVRMYLFKWQENILQKQHLADGLGLFFNILDLAIINACVVYKENTGGNIKSRDFILNLAGELRAKYVSSKLSLLSDLTPNAEEPTILGTKCKNCQINR